MIGTLTDAGPLVAIVDEGDPSHAVCMAQLPLLVPPMVTTWPCFTEAMYLAGSAGGHRAQDALWAGAHLCSMRAAPQSGRGCAS